MRHLAEQIGTFKSGLPHENSFKCIVRKRSRILRPAKNPVLTLWVSSMRGGGLFRAFRDRYFPPEVRSASLRTGFSSWGGRR